MYKKEYMCKFKSGPSLMHELPGPKHSRLLNSRTAGAMELLYIITSMPIAPTAANRMENSELF